MPLQYHVIVYLLLSFTSASEDSGVYCALRYTRLCQEKGQHIACQYPDPGQGESCENYTRIEFTMEMRNFILHYINRHRQRLASGHERARGGLPIPKPEIMMYVEWDRELAYLAQRLADQCRFVHDECRATVRYPYAGQTVGEVRWRRTRDSDELTAQRAVRKVFDAWWGEKRRVQPKQLTTPFKVTAKGTVWGHFTQLAVWRLSAVGCGAVRHGPSHPRFLLVCDYSHTNMLGQKTIPAGPLATCPPHTARRPHSQYPLLCSKIKYQMQQYEIDKFDYEMDVASEKEIIRNAKMEGYDPDDDDDDDEEDTTLVYRDSTTHFTHTDMDIYVKRTKTTGQYRKLESREEEYQRETTAEEYYTDTDVYVQTRNRMKNVQEYQQERRTTSTMHKNSDFEEERTEVFALPPKYWERDNYEKNGDYEDERRYNIVQNNREGGNKENKNDFEEQQRNHVVQKYRENENQKKSDYEDVRRNYIEQNDRYYGHYDKKSAFEEDQRKNDVQNNRDRVHDRNKKGFVEERRNSVVQKIRKSHDGKKSGFKEERRNIIVQNNRDYERKIPHLSNQDYSVIPLKGQANDVNIPWQPKLYQRTSTTEELEYETSIILVPKRRKGPHRLSTGTAGTLPSNVMVNVVRTYHDMEREIRPTTREHEKDPTHTVRRPVVPSLKLDKDDIDQLFRDTGFKPPNWTPKK